MSAYDTWNQLGPTEKKLVKNHPYAAFQVYQSKERAFETTKKYFGHNGRNDKSDAFRHCYWSALISKWSGAMVAKDFTDAHESKVGNPAHEMRMDQHNNTVGVLIGQSGASEEQMAQMCYDAAMNGKLITF